jgi:hypothetical protein
MSRKVLHIISQAHLDPVWLWPQRDGIAEALTTMQSAVDRAADFPQFKFTRSSAAVYRWAQEMDPVLFESIQQLVAEGRLAAASHALQLMVMQCHGDRIHLLPALAESWSVDFKLAGPHQTTVSCRKTPGQPTSWQIESPAKERIRILTDQNA